MRKCYMFLLAAVLAAPTSVLAEVNVNVSVGVPVPGVVVGAPPAVLFQAPPLFLAPRKLGFYVGVDVPYDIIFWGSNYYLYYGNGWYRASNYNGPWVVIAPDRLPPGIRKHRVEYIREYRDNEYRVYNRERERYPRRYVRDGREYRGYWKDEKRDWKEEKRNEREERKEERREHKRHGHDD